MEKRRYQRLPREITVDVTYIDPATNEREEIEKSCSRNISALGLLVLADKKLELDSLVQVEFYLPDSPEHIVLQARVVRVEELAKNELYDIGLEFVAIDDITLAKINAIVIHESSE